MKRRAFLAAAGGALASEDDFYLPEDPACTIVRSMEDSLRFTVERTLTTCKGKPTSRSSFVDPEGTPMMCHGFGPLEGPGWASNAVGGAYEICLYGRHFNNTKYQQVALGIPDHVLENGFVDEASGFIRGYRHTAKDAFVLNFTHNNDWFAPGAMARIGYQLLLCSDPLPHGARRVAPEGQPYRRKAESGRKDDPQFDPSADGLYIVQLMTALSERKLADYRTAIRACAAASSAASTRMSTTTTGTSPAPSRSAS